MRQRISPLIKMNQQFCKIPWVFWFNLLYQLFWRYTRIVSHKAKYFIEQDFISGAELWPFSQKPIKFLPLLSFLMYNFQVFYYPNRNLGIARFVFQERKWTTLCFKQSYIGGLQLFTLILFNYLDQFSYWFKCTFFFILIRFNKMNKF